MSRDELLALTRLVAPAFDEDWFYEFSKERGCVEALEDLADFHLTPADKREVARAALALLTTADGSEEMILVRLERLGIDVDPRAFGMTPSEWLSEMASIMSR